MPWRLLLSWAVCLFAFWIPAAAAGEPPRRVISLSPNLTETIFALGQGGRLVGVSEFCHWPPAAERLPKVGGWANPNLERMAELRPDLIIALGHHQSVLEFARQRGVRMVQLPMNNIQSIRGSIAEIGRLLECPDRATSLTAVFDTRLAVLRKEVAAHPGRPRPRVFVSITRSAGSLGALFTIGADSFLDEAIDLAGGVNVFHDLHQQFPEVSSEALIERRPDVILELEAGLDFNETQQQRLIGDWRALEMLPAVRDGRIHVLTDRQVLIAGPRLPELAAQFHAIFWGRAGGRRQADGVQR